LKYSIPLVSISGEIINISDSIFIYYPKDYYVYQIPGKYTVTNTIITKGKTEEDDKYDTRIVKQSILYSYFAFKKGAKTGCWFDNQPDSITRKQDVDSFLTAWTHNSNNEAGSIKKFNYTLLSRETGKSKNQFCDVYTPKVVGDIADSIYYYFDDNLKMVEHSLSRELDSQANSKLVKVISIVNEKKSIQYNMLLPKRKESSEIELRPITNKMQIEGIVEKMKKNQ
jgi:hypothetical protein